MSKLRNVARAVKSRLKHVSRRAPSHWFVWIGSLFHVSANIQKQCKSHRAVSKPTVSEH